MKPIFMVVGPPAVGKSTTSRALAARFPRSLHIPVDDIREMVVSGIVYPSPDQWPAELVEQFRLARASVTQMALTYRSAGFAVTIDDVMEEYHRRDYQTLFEQPNVHRILLYPSQEAAHQRNYGRSTDPNTRAYIDGGIASVYQALLPIVPELAQEGWLILDTTDLSVEAAVDTILERTRAAV